MSDSTSGSQFSSASLNYVSFDGSIRVPTTAYRPDRYRFWDPSTSAQYGISRGAGLSYTAASFSQDGVTVDHASFNRILDWDSAAGIVEVEPESLSVRSMVSPCLADTFCRYSRGIQK